MNELALRDRLLGLKIIRYRANILGASLDLVRKDLGGHLLRCTMQTDRVVRGSQI
jgi:hypothetical protein